MEWNVDMAMSNCNVSLKYIYAFRQGHPSPNSHDATLPKWLFHHIQLLSSWSLTSKSNQFISVPSSINSVNLVKFPLVVFNIY